jgi:hypothetical protein
VFLQSQAQMKELADEVKDLKIKLYDSAEENRLVKAQLLKGTKEFVCVVSTVAHLL